MAKTLKPEVEEPEPEPVDAQTQPEPGPDAGLDPEAFLAQIEARAHKGAAEGSKAALDEWIKTAVDEADLDAIDKELDGKRDLGPGAAAGAGGAGSRGGVEPPSLVREALTLLVGKPRIKRT